MNTIKNGSSATVHLKRLATIEVTVKAGTASVTLGGTVLSAALTGTKKYGPYATPTSVQITANGGDVLYSTGTVRNSVDPVDPNQMAQIRLSRIADAVYVGDSLVSNGSNPANGYRNTRSILQHAMRQLGRPFNIRNEVGFSGQRTDEVFAKWDAEVVPYNPGRVFWLTGNNDIFQGGNATTTFARLMLVRDRAAAEGRLLCLLPVAPSTGPEGQILMRMLIDRSKHDPFLEVIGSMARTLDYNVTAANIAAGTSLANMFTEGNTHPTGRCAKIVGDSIRDHFLATGINNSYRYTPLAMGNPGGNNPTTGDSACNMQYNGLIGQGASLGAGWSTSVLPANTRVPTATTQAMGATGMQAHLPGRLQRVVWAPGTAPTDADAMKLQSVWDCTAGAAKYAGKTFKGEAYIKASSTGGMIHGVTLNVSVYRWDWSGVIAGGTDNVYFDNTSSAVWSMYTSAYEGVYETMPFDMPSTWSDSDRMHVVTEVVVVAEPGATVTVDTGVASIGQIKF